VTGSSPEAALARLRPVLEILGSKVVHAAGIPAPLSQATVDAWASAAAALPADADHGEIARWLGCGTPAPGAGP
jgi:hypothetical protein